MICPSCGNTLNHYVLDKQGVLHCRLCGGSFFEDNGINRISHESAERLGRYTYNDSARANALKKCPKDGNVMAPIANTPSVPPSVTLLHCPLCFGVFAMPKDLLDFKKAQEAKVEYFKLWNIPLPNLKPVFIIASTIVVLTSVVLGVNTLQRSPSYNSQASDVLKTIDLQIRNNYIFVSFRTAQAFKSDIIFRNETTGQIVERPISSEPKTLHLATYSQLDILTRDDVVYYKIRLIDGQGRIVDSKEAQLPTDF